MRCRRFVPRSLALASRLPGILRSFTASQDDERKPVQALSRRCAYLPDMKRVAIAALLLAWSLPLAAQVTRREGFEAVLIPTYFSGPGAYGSRWETRVTIQNPGDDDVPMTRPVVVFTNVACPAVCCSAALTIPAKRTGTLCSAAPLPQTGMLLYVPKTDAGAQVEFSANIRDVSRDAQNAGTELPIARERDFRSGSLFLPPVSADSRFRAALRVYGFVTFGDTTPLPFNGTTVGVNIYSIHNQFAPIVSTTVTLNGKPLEGTLFEPVMPWAAILDLGAAFPELAATDSYYVELVPHQTLTSPPVLAHVWGFLSVTNNDTQQVTMFSPR